MDYHERECQGNEAVEPKSGHSEELLAQLRQELHDAIRAQEDLQAQLRAAVKELSETLRDQRPQASLETADRRLETRLTGVEQRLNRTTEQLQGILQSRIWRALVKAGGLLLVFSRGRRRK